MRLTPLCTVTINFSNEQICLERPVSSLSHSASRVPSSPQRETELVRDVIGKRVWYCSYDLASASWCWALYWQSRTVCVYVLYFSTNSAHMHTGFAFPDSNPNCPSPQRSDSSIPARFSQQRMEKKKVEVLTIWAEKYASNRLLISCMTLLLNWF